VTTEPPLDVVGSPLPITASLASIAAAP
jgi:hypothetical protein